MSKTADIHDIPDLDEAGPEPRLHPGAPEPPPADSPPAEPELVHPPAPAPAALPEPAVPADPIASLDAELAGLAEDLLQDEAGPDLAPPATFPPPGPISGSAPEPAPPPSAQEAAATAAALPEPPSEVPTEQTERTAPALAESQLLLDDAGPATGNRRGPRSQLLARAADRAYSLFAATSTPLDKHPPQLRSAIGWIAIFNLFLASCVWVYILALRSAEALPARPAASAAKAEAPPTKPDSAKNPGAH